MNKKIFITLLVFSLFLLFTYSYSFAATKAGNTIMNAGNSVGNAVMGATNTVVDGARSLGNTVVNAEGDVESDATNTINSNNNDTMDNTNGDYTATRTATGNGNLLGMSDMTWTWLIVGIVGLAIVGLVWYYGAQYEHRNYNND